MYFITESLTSDKQIPQYLHITHMPPVLWHCCLLAIKMVCVCVTQHRYQTTIISTMRNICIKEQTKLFFGLNKLTIHTCWMYCGIICFSCCCSAEFFSNTGCSAISWQQIWTLSNTPTGNTTEMNKVITNKLDSDVNLQESCAVAREPHDVAAVVFGLKFTDNIHYKFKSSLASKAGLQSSKHTSTKQKIMQNGHSRSRVLKSVERR